MGRVSEMAERVVVHELLAWWGLLNRELFGGRMVAPAMAIERLALLGRWHGASRTLTLSWQLVADRSWVQVVEVLKHEMAHQYVDEVLGMVGETSHGPTFRRVCAERSIDASAAGGARLPEEEATVLRRIQKLLALSESANEHEARAAMQAAVRLLREHGLSEIPSGHVDYAVVQVGVVRGRTPAHEQLLAGILAAHFDVMVVWVSAYDVVSGRRGRALEVAGRPNRVEVADYVHAFIQGTAERLWRQHRRQSSIRSDRLRRRFLEGVMIGFRAALQAEDRDMTQTGLVPVSDVGLQRWWRIRHPSLRKSSLHLRVDEAHAAGRAAGGTIRVRAGIRDGGHERLVLTGPADRG